MQIRRAFLLSIFSLFTLNSMACEQQEYSDELICLGTFKARTLADIETYKTNPKHALKNLAIGFNLEAGESLEVHTPCQVRFLNTNSVNTTGNLCVDARNGIYIQSGYQFNAQDVTLYSKKRIVFAPQVNVNVRDLALITFGDSIESRAHIRHNSVVTARNLTMKAQQRVTLGYESTFNISDKLILNSNLEFSAIWRDTSINAANVEITSNNLITLAGNVQINAPIYSATAAECKIPQTSTKSLSGNCNDTTRPKVRLKAFETNILKDTTLTFDTSRSLAPNGIKEMILKVNAQILSDNTYTFTSPGVYYVEAILIDNQDFKSSIKRKVVVKEVYKKDLRAYFRYEVRDEVLSLTYIQNIAKDQISTAKFKVYDQYGTTLLEERVLSNVYHLDTVEVEGLGKGTYKVGLEILKTDNELIIYEQDIFVGSNLEVSNALPLLDFDLYQSAPKEVFLDARRILDPYHNFKEIIVDWGDEESESFEPDFLIGEKHLYPSIATYEVKVTGIKENENGEEIIHEIIKEISVTNESVPSLAPIASFYYDINDQIPYVIFNINLVRSPTSTIENIKFDFGDGQIFEGTTENFPEIHTHFYDPGVYIATLTATDIQGLSTSLSSRIIVTESGPPLVTDLNCDVIEGKTISCETTLVDKYKEITNAAINWGDGSTSQLEVINGEWLWDNFDHTYDQFGKYNIEVTVNTIRGQSVTRTLEYELKDEVTPAPSLFLNCETNYLNLNCNAFTDFENASKLSRIDFYLDDVLVQSGASTSYNYTASENKSVKIYAVGSFGEEGISTSDAHNISLRANEAPVADFECSTNVINKISCINLSHDLEDVLISKWLVEENIFEGDSLEYPTNKVQVLVTIEVIDRGGLISRKEKIINVFTNIAPIASFDCLSEEINKVKCISNSLDEDGDDISYIWEVEGKVLFTNEIEFTSTAEIVNVKLIVNDIHSSSNSLEKIVYVKKNSPPEIESLNCQTLLEEKINCTVVASDIDNNIDTYKWYLDDRLVRVGGDTLKLDNIKKLSSTVKVIVTDMYSAISAKEKTVQLAPTTEVPKINCSQVDNFKVECELFNESEFLKIAGTSFEWRINDSLISSSSKLIYETGFTEIVNVRVKVFLYDSTIEKESSTSFEIVEKDLAEFKSSGDLEIVRGSNKYLSSNEKLKFIVKDVLVGRKEDGSYNDISISTDYTSVLSDNEVEILDDSIEVKNFLVDGYNEFSVSFVDNSGRTLTKSFKVYAGSRSFEFFVENKNAQNLSITSLEVGDFESETTHTFGDDGYIIENVPDKDMVFVISDGVESKFYIHKKGDAEQIIVSLAPRNFVLNDDNLDLSKDLEGFTIFKGEAQIKEQVVQESFDEGAILKPTLAFIPDVNGEIHYGIYTKAKDMLGKTHLEYSYFFSAIELNSFFAVKIFNKTSGETEVISLYKKDMIEGSQFQKFLEGLYIQANEDDEIYFEFYAKFSNVSANTSWLRKKIDYFINTAFADNVLENSSGVKELSLPISLPFMKNQNENFYLRDSRGTATLTLVTGPFNSRFLQVNPLGSIDYQFRFSNEIDTQFYEIVAYICHQGAFDSANCIIKNVYEEITGNVFYFEIFSGEVLPESDFLNVFFEVKNKLTGETVLKQKKLLTANKGKDFISIVNLEGLGRLDANSEVESNTRYNIKRDLENGGDEWISKSNLYDALTIIDWIHYFYDFSDKFFVKHEIRVDDLSIANSIATESHRSHNRASVGDFRFKSLDKNLSKVIQNQSQEIINVQDASSLIALMNKNIERLLITNKELVSRVFDKINKSYVMKNDKLTQDEISKLKTPFAHKVYSMCTENGGLANYKILHADGHSNHFHVQFYEKNPATNIKYTDDKYEVLPNATPENEKLLKLEEDDIGKYYKLNYSEEIKDFTKRVFVEDSNGQAIALTLKESAHIPFFLDEENKIRHSKLYFKKYFANLNREKGGEIVLPADNPKFRGENVIDIDNMAIDFRGIKIKVLYHNQNRSCSSIAEVVDVLPILPISKIVSIDFLAEEVDPIYSDSVYKSYSSKVNPKVKIGSTDEIIGLAKNNKIFQTLDVVNFPYRFTEESLTPSTDFIDIGIESSNGDYNVKVLNRGCDNVIADFGEIFLGIYVDDFYMKDVTAPYTCHKFKLCDKQECCAKDALYLSTKKCVRCESQELNDAGDDCKPVEYIWKPNFFITNEDANGNKVSCVSGIKIYKVIKGVETFETFHEAVMYTSGTIYLEDKRYFEQPINVGQCSLN